MGTSVQMLQKTYSRLTARLKAHKIKRQSYGAAQSKQEKIRTTTIVETDAELKNFAVDEVRQQEWESDDEATMMEPEAKGKST